MGSSEASWTLSTRPCRLSKEQTMKISKTRATSFPRRRTPTATAMLRHEGFSNLLRQQEPQHNEFTIIASTAFSHMLPIIRPILSLVHILLYQEFATIFEAKATASYSNGVGSTYCNLPVHNPFLMIYSLVFFKTLHCLCVEYCCPKPKGNWPLLE